MAAAPPVPAIPAYLSLPLPVDQAVSVAADGELSWLGQRPIEPAPKGLPQGCRPWELTMDRWQPATGATRSAPLAPTVTGFVSAQLPLPAGLLALTTNGCQDGPVRWRFMLFPAAGGPPWALQTEEIPTTIPVQLLALGDDAAVIVTRDQHRRHIQVFTIRLEAGRLVMVRMPALPVAYRGDFAAAVAGKEQLMILGGSDGPYRGCWDCRAESHVLDLKAGRWRAGPPMIEARSELGATTLPDGSVLVSGGWTLAAGWGNGPSRTAERWNPATDRFEPLQPMPTGNARHQFVWWKAPWGRTLLAVQGMVGAAHAYDPATGTWRTVAAWMKGSEEGGCGFFPFVMGPNAYAWRMDRSEGQSIRGCGGIDQKYGWLSLLRPPALATPVAQEGSQPPADTELISYRHGAAIVPAVGSEPMLLVGGSVHAGMNLYLKTGAVESVRPDGQVSTLPSLRIPRTGARAFRAAGGVLVVGGTGPDSPYGGERNPKPLPAEWLPPAGPTPWQWQEVSGVSLGLGAAVSQMQDGSLLVAEPGSAPQRMRLVVQDGQPRIESAAWPALMRERQDGPGETTKCACSKWAMAAWWWLAAACAQSGLLCFPSTCRNRTSPTTMSASAPTCLRAAMRCLIRLRSAGRPLRSPARPAARCSSWPMAEL